MLRRGIAALMMGVICAGSVTADEKAPVHETGPRGGFAQWMKNRSGSARGAQPAGGVERAVGSGTDTAAGQIQIRRVAAQSDDVVVVSPNLTMPQLKPIEQAPPVPNTDAVTGPQYFSAVPAGSSAPLPVHPSNNWQKYSPPAPVQATSPGYYTPISNPHAAGPVSMTSPGPVAAPYYPGQYPNTGASLYPAPVPGIPHQIGGTLIPNQALHPHEMLYAHRYRAMYPPYYYKVNGGWVVTPFGVWSHEDWKLQGTMVDVKYHSSISPFALYKRPANFK